VLPCALACAISEGKAGRGKGGDIVVQVQEVTYRCDDVQVPAVLFTPDEGGSGPGAVLCTGRFGAVEGLTFLANALAQQGIVTLATRYRGPHTFTTDDRDCSGAIDYLLGLPGVQGPIGLIGHSRGGMCALRTAAQDPRACAVVALAPPTDMERIMLAMREYAPLRYQEFLGAFGGPPETEPEVYRQLSAVRYADRIRVPVLLICGTLDLVSPVDHCFWMRDALHAAGNHDVRVEVLNGVGHFFERGYSGYVFDVVANLGVPWLVEWLRK
jgi:dipeptidyl aminopeptidase/acylaminoacyl peptidase